MNDRSVSKRTHQGTRPVPGSHASAEERRAYGRSLRDATPRAAHARFLEAIRKGRVNAVKED